MHRSIARCTSCRVSVLDAFTSLAGISIPTSVSRQSLRQAQIKPSRAFSQFRPLRQFSPPSSQPIDNAQTPPLAPEAEVEAEVEAEASESKTFIPWYLEVEEPAPPTTSFSPILSSQEIPPLPANSPPILAPVLEHLSTQIGLDNLVLLDLRHLDPPPALGANLLMIIGTARSVKHLNVSGDRFCRWVRKEYKMRPYADGLLGRNELKLKLRRKARRLRLAQSVGNTTMDEMADDGITTGWICVNMGAVDIDLPAETQSAISNETIIDEEVQAEEDEEEEYHNPPEEEMYAGFGSRDMSTRIVVQMFTEEKRVEFDLEGLWDVRNTRRAQREEDADAVFDDSNVEGEGDSESKLTPRGRKRRQKNKQQSQKPVRMNEMEDSRNESATPIADEVDDPQKREEFDESKPLGGMGAS